jgi:hypothetical protein
MSRQDARPALVSIICFLAVGYIFLYEWGVFEADALRTPVTVAKLLVPVILLVLIPVRIPQSKAFKRFILFYFLFMVWALAPVIASGEFQDTALVWFRYMPRFFFALLIGVYFLRQPEAPIKLMKFLVIVGAITVVQFCLLVPAVMFDLVGQLQTAGLRGAIYAGPFGILGNQTATMFFPGLSLPVFRLTGFWLEPSNASGFLFAAFFLARVIFLIEKKRFWRIMSYVCLVGGFLALSNAGYLAIASPILFSCLFMKKSRGKFVYVLVLTVLALGLAFFAVGGRTLVNEQYGSSAGLRALAGARAGTEFDPYGGRVELLQKNLDLVISKPFGIGIKVAGEGVAGSYEEASGSAPILWLAYTGVLGLLLLAFREYQIIKVAIKYSRESPIIMGAAQAWLAMCVQHLVYGTWMTPAYLVLCALVTSTVLQYHRTTQPSDLASGKVPRLKLRQTPGIEPKKPALST